jgi:hypothetical protein
LGGERLESEKCFDGLDGLTLGQIGGAEEHVGLERLRRPRDEALQVLDGGLDRTSLETRLGQEEDNLGEVGAIEVASLSSALACWMLPAWSWASASG